MRVLFCGMKRCLLWGILLVISGAGLTYFSLDFSILSTLGIIVMVFGGLYFARIEEVE